MLFDACSCGARDVVVFLFFSFILVFSCCFYSLHSLILSTAPVARQQDSATLVLLSSASSISDMHFDMSLSRLPA